MLVKNFFTLSEQFKNELKGLTPPWGYNEFSEFLFYRTYSRVKDDGSMESWADVVIRVTEGCFSIRKDWYLKNNLLWDEEFWQHYSRNFATYLFNMYWLPAGRGLWAMGSQFVYERGSMALLNCAFLEISKDIGDDAHWAMDALMCGVGVGFAPIRDDELTLVKNSPSKEPFIIQDTRESWCDSVKLLIDSYTRPLTPIPTFDYSLVRPAGLPIKGFGGISSGPEPLAKLHKQLHIFFNKFSTDPISYDSVRLKTDILNAVAACVVAGNVRRSAQIALGKLDDHTFINLKNYKLNPERQAIGGMSNNSVYLESDEDFDSLDDIAERIKNNGEPGVLNVKNMKYGRIGKFNDNVPEDNAIGINPCGEQPLSNKELCNLVETFPTKCPDIRTWHKALEYATVYASTVTLLPTHRPETNNIMMKNRRIGVSISDITGWMHNIGRNKVVKHLKFGYRIVRRINHWVNSEAGIPDSIRVTTCKPGGTIPKLVGVTSGCGYPNFKYMVRRVRIGDTSPILPLLLKANIPNEPDKFSQSTLVFSFPLKCGPAKPSLESSLWEQAFNLIMMQREWSDNAVSNTLNFKPKWIKIQAVPLNQLDDPKTISNLKVPLDPSIFNYQDTYETKNFKAVINHLDQELEIFKFNPEHEEDIVASVLSAICPHIKSASLLPQTYEGVYAQMPEEGITEEQYYKLKEQIKPIDWSLLRNSDTTPELYCTSEKCERL